MKSKTLLTIFVIILSILSVSLFVNAQSLPNLQPERPNVAEVDYNSTNVNNSYYWQGYTPTTFISVLDGLYYSISNPSNFINESDADDLYIRLDTSNDGDISDVLTLPHGLQANDEILMVDNSGSSTTPVLRLTGQGINPFILYAHGNADFQDYINISKYIAGTVLYLGTKDGGVTSYFESLLKDGTWHIQSDTDSLIITNSSLNQVYKFSSLTNVGADFYRMLNLHNENITNVGTIRADYYGNDTDRYTVQDFLQGDGTNYTNVALTNQSNTFSGTNQFTNGITAGFIDANLFIFTPVGDTDTGWRVNGANNFEFVSGGHTTLGGVGDTVYIGEIGSDIYISNLSSCEAINTTSTGLLQCTSLPTASSGNPFNQSLNTTDHVTFASINTTENISVVKGLYVDRIGRNEYSSSNYATLLINADGHPGNAGGGILATRYNESKEPFVAFSVWDFNSGGGSDERAQYNCGGGWGAPACTIQYGYFSQDYATESGPNSDDQQYVANFDGFAVRQGEVDHFGFDSNVAEVGGVIDDDTSLSQNTGTGNTFLFSHTIPARSLSTDGDAIRFKTVGYFNLASGVRNINVTFGGNVINSNTVNNFSTSAFSIEGMITRINSTDVVAYTELRDTGAITDSTSDPQIYSFPITFTSNNLLRIATSGGSGSNKTLIYFTKVYWEPGK